MIFSIHLPWHLTPALSLDLQLCIPIPLLRQSSKELSSPLHRTSSSLKKTGCTSPNSERSVAIAPKETKVHKSYFI